MPKLIHQILDGFVDQIASSIAVRAQQLFARSPAARRIVMISVRACPYPVCTMPGAGPRNRWFCQEHARTVPIREQKRILL